MLVRIPRNETTIRQLGPYVRRLDLLDHRRTAVQRQVRRGGLASYEPGTQATLLSLVQLSRRPAEFFDIGAHIGLYSALVGAIFPPDLVHVTAFEPTPDTARMCRTLAERNHIPIWLEQCALSSCDGSATLHISEKAETSNSLMAGFRPSSESISVRVTTIDNYCLLRNTHPTVMKVDVETFEAEVLRGALQTIKDARPAIVCEILPTTAPGAIKTILKIIVSIGYKMHYWRDPRGWVESNSMPFSATRVTMPEIGYLLRNH